MVVDDHCGWDFPWDPFQFFFNNNSVYHDVHHQTYGIKANFSQPFFTYCMSLLARLIAGDHLWDVYASSISNETCGGNRCTRTHRRTGRCRRRKSQTTKEYSLATVKQHTKSERRNEWQCSDEWKSIKNEWQCKWDWITEDVGHGKVIHVLYDLAYVA